MPGRGARDARRHEPVSARVDTRGTIESAHRFHKWRGVAACRFRGALNTEETLPFNDEAGVRRKRLHVDAAGTPRLINSVGDLLANLLLRLEASGHAVDKRLEFGGFLPLVAGEPTDRYHSEERQSGFFTGGVEFEVLACETLRTADLILFGAG